MTHTESFTAGFNLGVMFVILLVAISSLIPSPTVRAQNKKRKALLKKADPVALARLHHDWLWSLQYESTTAADLREQYTDQAWAEIMKWWTRPSRRLRYSAQHIKAHLHAHRPVHPTPAPKQQQTSRALVRAYTHRSAA